MMIYRMIASAVCAASVCVAPAFAASVNLPAGTRVEVRLVRPLSSGDATVGQRFLVQAAGPVMVAHHVVITNGASGSGRVVRVSKAHGKSAGELTLQFVNIHAADGSLVPLTEAASNKGSAEKGKASTATIAATIALGPLGLFAHNMVKGKDVTVTSDQTFPAWVKTNTAVNVP